MPTGKIEPCRTSAVCNALMDSKLARSALAATALLCSLHMAHGASTYPVDMCEAFYSTFDPDGHGLWDADVGETNLRAARSCVTQGDPLGPASVAYALIDMGRIREAIDVIRQGRDAGGDEASLLRTECLVLRKQDKPSEAIPLCRRAVQLNPSIPLAYATLSNAYYEVGNKTEALAVVEEGLRRAPSYGLLLTRRGSLLHEMGKIREAIAPLEAAHKLAPKAVDSAIALAKVYRELVPARHAEGVAVLTRVLSSNQDLPSKTLAQLYHQRGFQLELSGDKIAAIADYDRAIQLTPKNPEYLWEKGYTLLLLNRNEEADREFVRALALKPDYARAVRARAQVAMEKGDLNTARAGFDRALELDPKDALNWKFSGEAHMRLENYQLGLQHLEKAVQMLPNDAIVWHNRGMAFYELGRIDDAIRSLSRGIELNPKQGGGGSYFWRARAFSLQGKAGEAISDYTSLIKLNPSYLWAWRNRADLRYRVGDMTGAFQDFEHVAKTRPRELEMDWFLWTVSGLESGKKSEELLAALRANPSSSMPSGRWAEALLLGLIAGPFEAEEAFEDAADASPPYRHATAAAELLNRVLDNLSQPEPQPKYPLDEKYQKWSPPRFNCETPVIPDTHSQTSVSQFNGMVSRYNSCAKNWMDSIQGGVTRNILGDDVNKVSAAVVMSMNQKIDQIWDAHLSRIKVLNDEIRRNKTSNDALSQMARTMTEISRSLPKPRRIKKSSLPFISAGQR